MTYVRVILVEYDQRVLINDQNFNIKKKKFFQIRIFVFRISQFTKTLKNQKSKVLVC